MNNGNRIVQVPWVIILSWTAIVKKFDEQSEVQFCAFKIGAFIDHNNIFGLYHLN